MKGHTSQTIDDLLKTADELNRKYGESASMCQMSVATAERMAKELPFKTKPEDRLTDPVTLLGMKVVLSPYMPDGMIVTQRSNGEIMGIIYV